MKKTVIIIALGIVSIALIGSAMSSPEGWEREDEDSYVGKHDARDHEKEHGRDGWLRSREDVAPVRDEAYREECGGCHFAYQPGLLPAPAWDRIMGSLGEHYGDDASLGSLEALEIRGYLMANAADRSELSRSRAFAANQKAGGELPRITETAYFRREHHEVPARLVQGNAEVGSFSNCQSCHVNAGSGVYNEHEVVIPGIGRWDD